MAEIYLCANGKWMGSIVSGQFWAIEILDYLAFGLPYHFWEFPGQKSDIYVVKQDDLYFSMKTYPNVFKY